ncbi:MAG: TRAP transporter substrate-binding protein [Akkermansiaceae bacterium]|jgi:tripartite ATP-independent transporter DctP family solute receptor|nr:TRAP transporter substrate-binding protein [Akkermansiaceae bacterium]
MKSTQSNFILGLLLGILVCCLGFAWIGQRSESGLSGSNVKTVTIAHALPVTHPVHKGIEEFGRELSELSGGTMKVNIFPSEQLGTETVCLEKTQQGEIDITKVSCAPIGNFVPVFKIFSLPYLFRDRDHFWKVLDGEVGGSLLDALETKDEGGSSGLVGLTYYDAGARSFYAIRPLSSASDLKGLKIRVMQDPVAESTVKSLGASAVTMSFGELYTSLKQGGVDGAENNPPSLLSSRHFEICKHYMIDEHSRIPDVLIAGSKFWDKLSEQEKGWVREAAKRSSTFQRELWEKDTESSLEELKKAGVTITRPDLAAFQTLTTGVVKEFATDGRMEYVTRIKEVK